MNKKTLIKKIESKNKKADVAVTLLVIMTLAVCGIAIVNFLFYNSQSLKDVSGYGIFAGLDYGEQNFEFFNANLAREVVYEIKIDKKDLTSEEFWKRFLDKYRSYYSEANGELIGNAGDRREMKIDKGILILDFIDVTFKVDLSDSKGILTASHKRNMHLELKI